MQQIEPQNIIFPFKVTNIKVPSPDSRVYDDIPGIYDDIAGNDCIYFFVELLFPENLELSNKKINMQLSEIQLNIHQNSVCDTDINI